MGRYILKRLGQAIIVMFLVTFLTFLILHLLPGGAARSALGKEATEAQLMAYNAQMGYDQPFIIQYGMYLGRLFQGDLGFSFQQNQEISALISQRMPKTIVLSLLSTIVAVTIAVPLGPSKQFVAIKPPTISSLASPCWHMLRHFSFWACC